MTAWEKFNRDHPNHEMGSIRDYKLGCPNHYGYLPLDGEFCVLNRCEDCWNREIPEEKEKEMANEEYESERKRLQNEIQTLNEKLEQADGVIDIYRKTIERNAEKIEKYELIIKTVEALCDKKIIDI